MKRSFSQVGKGVASTPTTPGMTRAFSHGSAPASSGEAPLDSTLHLIKHQNKELTFALKSKKRCIRDLRRQLQHEKQQSAVAEDLLSILDRSYNQFNDDISRMISILASQSTDSGVSTKTDSKSKEWLSLLQIYLESGESYFEVTPVSEIGMIREDEDEDEDKEGHGEGEQVNMLHLRPDDWASTAEIEELRQEALKQLLQTETTTVTKDDQGSGEVAATGVEEDMEIDDDDITRSPPRSSSSATGSSPPGADVLVKGTAFSSHDRVKAINSELSQRTRSIKAKLHTLLKALQAKLDTPAITSSPITQSMAQTRQLRAEKLLLTELLAKYKAEIINLQAEVRFGERRLQLQERAKYFALTGKSVSAEEGTEKTSTSADAKHDATAGTGEGSGANDSAQVSATASGGASTASSGSGDIDGEQKSANSSENMGTTSALHSGAGMSQQQEEAAAKLRVAQERQGELEVLVTVLQQQLADTEGLRSAAEQALALYIHHAIASPLSSSSSTPVSSISSDDGDIISKLTSSQRADMEQRWSREEQELEKARQLLQDTRQQSQKKLSDMEQEKNSYFRRMSELELAMNVLTEASSLRVSAMTEQMKKQTEVTQQEKEAAVASLRTIQQELQMFELTKARLIEAETVEASTKRQCAQLSERIKAQNKSAELTDQHLLQSRKRESELTSQLTAAAMSKEQRVRQVAYDAGLKEQQDEAEEGMISEEGSIDITKYESVQKAQQECHRTLTSLVESTQTRLNEVTAELLDAKENINDLILEIESVANEEERSRAHNARLVKQLGDTHGEQKEMRMENLRLHQEIHDMHEKSEELKEKKAELEVFMKQQEEVVTTLKATVQRLHAERHQLNGSLVTATSCAETRNREREEADSRCVQAEGAAAECRRKISDLKTRCGELSKQHEAERKQRLGVERQLATLKATNARLRQQQERSSSDAPHTSSSTDSREEKKEESDGTQQMLDMTLNMLRCSVCHDRFKEVALTRCFHLFCKTCIDLNLSSRHRKCPACGERFGQDDVKAVYFTH